MICKKKAMTLQEINGKIECKKEYLIYRMSDYGFLKIEYCSRMNKIQESLEVWVADLWISYNRMLKKIVCEKQNENKGGEFYDRYGFFVSRTK